MPSDEELRKVAEDVRALARSLARDVWDAAHSARSNGHPAGEALRNTLRDAAWGARREFQRGRRQHRPGWGGPPPYGRRYPGPPRPGEDAAGPAAGLYGSHRDRAPWPPYAPWTPFGLRGSRYREPSGRDRPLPPVRRKWDASMLAALLVVMFGVAWAAGALGLAHLAPEAVLAAGLMLLGASLIVTARTDWSLSRHAWPVMVGVVLVAGLFATSSSFGVAGALSHVSFGDMATTAAPGRTVYGGFGRLTVTVPDGYAGSNVRIESVAGNTVVLLPANVTATVHARVLAGQVCTNGHLSDGVGATETEQVGNGRTPLTVDVHQLAGQVTVVSTGCHP